MAALTREELEERNARIALRLRQLAIREHQRLHGRSQLRECKDPDCLRTWRLLEFNEIGPTEPPPSNR